MRVLIWRSNEEESFWTNQHQRRDRDWLKEVFMRLCLLTLSLQRNLYYCNNWMTSWPFLCSFISTSNSDFTISSSAPISLLLSWTLSSFLSGLYGGLAILDLLLCALSLTFDDDPRNRSTLLPSLLLLLFSVLATWMALLAPSHMCTVLTRGEEAVVEVQEKRLWDFSVDF